MIHNKILVDYMIFPGGFPLTLFLTASEPTFRRSMANKLLYSTVAKFSVSSRIYRENICEKTKATR
jgi:hypothetical protein